MIHTSKHLNFANENIVVCWRDPRWEKLWENVRNSLKGWSDCIKNQNFWKLLKAQTGEIWFSRGNSWKAWFPVYIHQPFSHGMTSHEGKNFSNITIKIRKSHRYSMRKVTSLGPTTVQFTTCECEEHYEPLECRTSETEHIYKEYLTSQISHTHTRFYPLHLP